MIKRLVWLLVVIGCFSCEQRTENATTPDHVAFQNPAIKTLSERIVQDPDNARLYFDRGNLLHRLQYDTLALEDFKTAAKLDSSKAEYFSAVGDLMFEQKDISGSVPWLERAVRLNPNDPTAQLKIAKMLIFLKDYPKAFSTINKVLRRNALVPDGYFLKGLIYKDLKDTAKAVSSFRTAIQVDPSHVDAQIQLGLLFSAKRDDIALRYFDNAFAADTTDVFPLYAKGMYFQEQKLYEKAKEEYERCVAYNPGYTKAIFSTGWILMQQDSLQKAWRQFDLVTKLEPTDPEAYYNRGLCSELMNKNAEALQDYKQALTFNISYKAASDGIKRLGGN